MPAQPPDALLFITPGCPHCPQVLQALADLLKQGLIGRLEAVNVATHPEMAAQHGVRSAPWTRLGPFELEGSQSAGELKDWARLAGQPDGITRYLERLLRDGQLKQAEQQISRQPEWLTHLLPLLQQAELPMQIRLGIGALFENHAGQPELQQLVPQLAELMSAADATLRADLCHYLGLSGSPAARPVLENCLQDDSADIREIAREALEQTDG